MAAVGLLFIAMVLVPGQNMWNTLRSWLLGSFGILTYFVGPFLLYLAYLVASGYRVGVFAGKTALMAMLCAAVPVVFSKFAVGEATFTQVVKMLFAWGQTRFWSGGVLGGPIGAVLVALFGRPASNVIMLLIFLWGLMFYFALTPRDVVQFAMEQYDRWQQARAAREQEAQAYDTRLFEEQPEEEPLESLIETLPQYTGRRQPVYDIEADLAKAPLHAAPKKPAPQPAAAAPAQPVAPHPESAPAKRAGFDVDLGPDATDKALQQALQNDPLEPVVIGPGGTFGMDPLSQPRRSTAPAEPQPSGTFELHLDAGEHQLQTTDELDELIDRAMAGQSAASEQQVSSEVRLDLDEETVDDPFGDWLGDLTPAEPPAEPIHVTREALDAARAAQLSATPRVPGDTVALTQEELAAARAAWQAAQTPAAQNPNGIPALGGSFDPARAAWESGVPMSSVLAGQVAAPQPAPAWPGASGAVPTPDVDDTDEIEPLPQDAHVRVSTAVGNSASAPISSPPSAQHLPLQSQTDEKPPEPYCYPSLNLFNATRPEDEAGAAQEMKHNADVLVHTLDSFGVRTKILDICRGPSVTRYELQPQAGVKVSRITSLADDISLNLATAGVRIEAPIPGKAAVGIEVPNRIRSTVNIRTVFESQNYINMRSPLTMALGKDIAGTAQVADLCKMPHLLIAGSTGSGKSVCVNSIIISFLFRSGPEDVKLLLIDPKVVELAEYNGIPHLLMPVVTEPRKAAGALGASVAEMERRYNLFAENNVREIKAYNKLAARTGLEHLPYIAIVIDELADLMMVAGKEVEDYICRIAQKARAAGIHLIVATQRPSVDVITGLIKANIPSRIAFAVSSQIDSRTILDGSGAEKLLGNGDMLFLPLGANKPTRVQGTFVTDEEIGAVLSFIKSTSSAQYDEEMIAEMERRAVAEKGAKKGEDDGESGGALDPMFEQAVECVIEAGQASTSLLQRRCKLGYARAARIMDQMEQEKVIGPYEGAKPRAVLLTKSQWEERKLSGHYEEP